MTETPHTESPQTPAAEIHPAALLQPPFSKFLRIKVVSATPDRIESEMVAFPELINRNGVLHGGAIMALADNNGGTGAFTRLAEDQGTTTVESKTNFFRAIPAGDLVRAVTIPLHIGRKTTVWQTSIYRGDGKLAALVTQTQFTLPGEPAPA
ncbi:hotdog fold thioesterase [bacterium]|nr:hotdog fold thioesterase [bacterium]